MYSKYFLFCFLLHCRPNYQSLFNNCTSLHPILYFSFSVVFLLIFYALYFFLGTSSIWRWNYSLILLRCLNWVSEKVNFEKCIFFKLPSLLGPVYWFIWRVFSVMQSLAWRTKCLYFGPFILFLVMRLSSYYISSLLFTQCHLLLHCRDCEPLFYACIFLFSL